MCRVFQLGELTEAEDALAEANVLNNYDPEVWAYLSLVCLRTARQLEAEQAYKYAIKVRTSRVTSLVYDVHCTAAVDVSCESCIDAVRQHCLTYISMLLRLN